MAEPIDPVTNQPLRYTSGPESQTIPPKDKPAEDEPVKEQPLRYTSGPESQTIPPKDEDKVPDKPAQHTPAAAPAKRTP